jgi:hypothetical protein
VPAAGLVSLLWFLVRVLPKPSRAAYPCQRVAAPIASGFVIWLVTGISSTLAYRKARALWERSRYAVAGAFLVLAVSIVWIALGTANEHVAGAFTPTDSPNTPIGVAKGIHPGRVVWVHEPNVTSWDGHTGQWWDDANTDQALVDRMVSEAIRRLTGKPQDSAAWDALFRYFNCVHGNGDVGYQPGEKIAVKLNMNQDSGDTWRSGAGVPSPHVVYALLNQLIRVVGVAGHDITLYDATKYIGDPIYWKVKADPSVQFQAVRFVVRTALAVDGREGASLDTSSCIHFAHAGLPDGGRANLPSCVTEAKYLINMALLRAHDTYGATLCAKNHFGSIRFPSLNWGPGPLHDLGSRNTPMGTYSCLVDLIGSRHLGGKTLLYMIDALYPAADNSSEVIRWKSFGNDWCSSLFVSQDPVAIDSVGIDFLRNEPESTYVQRGQGLDNYLHEAALAYDPPSGTVYDPQGDGSGLESLGVHEHWNNPVDRQYSRNLHTGEGIELVAARLDEGRADVTRDGVIDARDLQALTQVWLADPNAARWDLAADLSGDGWVDFRDWAWFAGGWR